MVTVTFCVETERADEFPIHVVCEWIGNSPDVARKHSFTAQSVHAESRTDSDQKKETAASLAFAGGAAVAESNVVPPRGVEPRFSD